MATRRAYDLCGVTLHELALKGDSDVVRVDLSLDQLRLRKENWEAASGVFVIRNATLTGKLKQSLPGRYTCTRARAHPSTRTCGVPLFTDFLADLERRRIQQELASNKSLQQEVLTAYKAQKKATLLVYKQCGVTPPVIALPAKKQPKPPKPPRVQPIAVSAHQRPALDPAAQALVDASVLELKKLSEDWVVASRESAPTKAALEARLSNPASSCVRVSLSRLQVWSEKRLYKILPHTVAT
jgi:hypothetical protein